MTKPQCLKRIRAAISSLSQLGILSFLLMGCIRPAVSADWPQWRGPNRDGVAPESPPLADAWPPGDPKLVWRVDKLMNGGQETGHSSPVIANGRVYLYGYWRDAGTPDGAYDAIACLSTNSGSVLWRSIFPAVAGKCEPRDQGSTPCVVGGRLYLAGRLRAYCLDAMTGKLLWQQPTGDTNLVWAIASSFAVVDGVAIMICAGVYGFDAVTGQIRWHREEAPGPWNPDGSGAGSLSSPVCWRHAGKDYVVCCVKSAELMDPATGGTIWKIPWTRGAWSSWNGHSSPAIIGDQMVLLEIDGGMEGYPLSLDAPTKLWHIPDHDCGTSPLIYEGHVYTIGGGDYSKPTSIRCADLQTGAIDWEKPTQPQGCSSPIAADGKIFGYLQFGRLLCMWKADPNHYTVLAATPVNADGYSSPAFADGRLFLRLNDGVACYDVTRAANPTAREAQEALRPKILENQAKALRANQEGAARGDAYGEYRMGQRYRDGDGVPKDLTKAREWLEKAASQGIKDAARELTELPDK